MARTRRKHSYRKSRRWNPEMAPGFAAALAKTPVKSTGFSSVAAMPNPKGRRRGMRGGRFTGKPAFRLVTKGPGRYLNNSTDWEDMGGRAAAYVKKYGWPTEGGHQGNPRGHRGHRRKHRHSRYTTWRTHRGFKVAQARQREENARHRNPRGHRGHKRKHRKWTSLGRMGRKPRHSYTYRVKHRNPRGRSTRSSRARTWHRKVRGSVPWWSKGKNPRKGSYYSGRTHTRRGRKNPRGHRGHKRKNRRHFRIHDSSLVGRSNKFRYRRGRHKVSRAFKKRGYIHGRRNPRKGSYARRYLKKLSPARRKHVVSYALGSFNPRRRAKRGRRR